MASTMARAFTVSRSSSNQLKRSTKPSALFSAIRPATMIVATCIACAQPLRYHRAKGGREVSRGYIAQRSPGSWRVHVSGGFDDAGKRIRITETIRGTERAAQKALTRLLKDVDDGKVAKVGSGTFGSYLVDRWLPHMRSRVGSETWDRYESLVRVHIVPRCGQVRLTKLRPHHLQAALDAMEADGAASASVTRPSSSCRAP
jgi:Phage integrase, N-terminal SAM-like domain